MRLALTVQVVALTEVRPVTWLELGTCLNVLLKHNLREKCVAYGLESLYLMVVIPLEVSTHSQELLLPYFEEGIHMLLSFPRDLTNSTNIDFPLK